MNTAVDDAWEFAVRLARWLQRDPRVLAFEIVIRRGPVFLVELVYEEA